MKSRAPQEYPFSMLAGLIIDRVNEMELICELALVGKIFYKAVGEDFCRLCLRNQIYRLAGETWCLAFKCSVERWYSFYNTKFTDDVKLRPSMYGEAFMITNQNWAVILNLDMNKPVMQSFNFDYEVWDAALDPLGKLVLIQPKKTDGLRIYDIKTGKLVAQECHEGSVASFDCIYIAAEERIFCVSNQRWWPLKMDGKVSFIPRDQIPRRYILFKVDSVKVYVLDSTNGRVDMLTEFTGPFRLRFLNDDNHVILHSDTHVNFKIFDLTKPCLLFSHSSDSTEKDLVVVDDRIIIDYEGRILFFDEKTGSWLWHETLEQDLWVDKDRSWGFAKNLLYSEKMVFVIAKEFPVLPYFQLGYMRLRGRKLLFTPFQTNTEPDNSPQLFTVLCDYFAHLKRLPQVMQDALTFQKLVKAIADVV